MSWVEKNRKINNRGGGRGGGGDGGTIIQDLKVQIRANVVTNWGSFNKLGQPLFQNGTAITNWGKMYYKLGQLLQIRAIITNWGHNSNSLIKNLTPFEDDAEICLLNFLM